MPLDLEDIRQRQQTAMRLIDNEPEPGTAAALHLVALEGTLIGVDVPALIGEVERLRKILGPGYHCG